jgi:hypothetical protein
VAARCSDPVPRPFGVRGSVVAVATAAILIGGTGPGALGSGLGYNQSYTTPRRLAVNPAVDLVLLRSADLGGANPTVTFAVAGTVTFPSGYAYFVNFNDSPSPASCAGGGAMPCTASVQCGPGGTGAGQCAVLSRVFVGTVQYAVSGAGSTLTGSVAKTALPSPTGFCVSARAYGPGRLGNDLGCDVAETNGSVGTAPGLSPRFNALLEVFTALAIVAVAVVVILVVWVVIRPRRRPPLGPASYPPAGAVEGPAPPAPSPRPLPRRPRPGPDGPSPATRRSFPQQGAAGETAARRPRSALRSTRSRRATAASRRGDSSPLPSGGKTRRTDRMARALAQRLSRRSDADPLRLNSGRTPLRGPSGGSPAGRGKRRTVRARTLGLILGMIGGGVLALAAIVDLLGDIVVLAVGAGLRLFANALAVLVLTGIFSFLVFLFSGLGGIPQVWVTRVSGAILVVLGVLLLVVIVGTVGAITFFGILPLVGAILAIVAGGVFLLAPRPPPSGMVRKLRWRARPRPVR